MVTVPPKPLQFGLVSGSGPRRLKAEVSARVAAGLPYRLTASFQGLREEAGQRVAISPKQMKITINGKEVPIGTERIAIATGGPTPAGGVNVPIVIVMELKGAEVYPAGRYGGNLALALVPEL